MRFNKIDAPAFGPLRDSLELAPGMNVIYGPNEAGKSSWHAALYAGLCGIPRGRGNSKALREFTERHKPWDTQDWEVNAVITLADARRVELRNDLANKLSSARDTNIARRDYANEIMHGRCARWVALARPEPPDLSQHRLRPTSRHPRYPRQPSDASGRYATGRCNGRSRLHGRRRASTPSPLPARCRRH